MAKSVFLTKGEEKRVANPAQVPALEKEGWKVSEPPAENPSAGLETEPESPLGPGQQKMVKDDQTCIADERQIPQLKSAGWKLATSTDTVESVDTTEEANHGSRQLPRDEVGEKLGRATVPESGEPEDGFE